MKYVSSLRGAKIRSRTSTLVKRGNRLFVIDKANPRHKVSQGKGKRKK